MVYRIEATASACVWRAFTVEAENVNDAERKALEIAKSDLGYIDSGTEWELNGLLGKDGRGDIAVTVCEPE